MAIVLGFITYARIVDEKMTLRSRRLLDQPELSLSNKAQFFTVVRNIHTASYFAEERLDVIYWIVAFCAMCLVLDLGLIRSLIYNSWRLPETQILGVTIPNPHIYVVFSLVILSGYVIAWPLVWRLWNKEPPPFRISPAMVNSLLTTTPDGQWN